MIIVSISSTITNTHTAHAVEFVRRDANSQSAKVIMQDCGQQNRDDDAPTTASIATGMLLRLEAEIVELRKHLERSGLLDHEVTL